MPNNDTCLLDDMLDAQAKVGQITWLTITEHSATGTYDNNGTQATITVTN